MNGILYMRTSCRFSVAGETRKCFSTLLSELKNELAFSIKNRKEKTFDLNLPQNDEKLFERAVSVEALKKAWLMLRIKLNKFRKSSDFSDLTYISNLWFVVTSNKLLKGSFKYPRLKRIKTEEAFIVNDFKTKIIEQAFLNVLEPLFERKGPNLQRSKAQKSINQVLRKIKYWRINTSFFINFSIDATFNGINRKRLKNIFNSCVRDNRFWVEISKILNSGVVKELKYLFQRGYNTQTKNSILCLFLFNLYFHKLDQKVASLQKKTSCINKSNKSYVYSNPKALSACREFSPDFAKKNLKTTLKKCGSKVALIETQKIIYKNYHRKLRRRNPKGSDIRYIQYARYAGDFLFGIVGSRDYGLQICKDISNFIKGNLHLKIKKEELLYKTSKATRFLGHDILLIEFEEKKMIRSKNIMAARKNKNKLLSKFLRLDKRFAKAKSYQLYSNVLLQFNALSKELGMNLKDTNHVSLLSLIFAYKSIGFVLMKQLRFINWKQFVALLTLLDSPKILSGKVIATDFAIKRWFFHLNTEANKLNKLNVIMLQDKMVSWSKSEFVSQLSKGLSNRIKILQQNYFDKTDYLTRNSLGWVVKKEPSTVRAKFNKTREAVENLSNEDERLKVSNSKKIVHRRISIQAPISAIFTKLRVKGYIHPIKDKAIGNAWLSFRTDLEIVQYFNILIKNLLYGFSGSNNFVKVKSLAYLLRKSCVLTLVNKHKKSQSWVYTAYGSGVEVNEKGKKKILLIGRSVISNFPNKFNLKRDYSLLNWFYL